MGKHKNSNDAVGNYGIYQIMTDDVVYKIGKADLDRITKSTNTATRIHQQVRKLRKKYVKQNVFYILLEELLGSTTSHAKKVEQAILEIVIMDMGYVPEGNSKSYKPKK